MYYNCIVKFVEEAIILNVVNCVRFLLLCIIPTIYTDKPVLRGHLCWTKKKRSFKTGDLLKEVHHIYIDCICCNSLFRKTTPLHQRHILVGYFCSASKIQLCTYHNIILIIIQFIVHYQQFKKVA